MIVWVHELDPQKRLLIRKKDIGKLSNRILLIRIVCALDSILYNTLVVLR